MLMLELVDAAAYSRAPPATSQLLLIVRQFPDTDRSLNISCRAAGALRCLSLGKLQYFTFHWSRLRGLHAARGRQHVTRGEECSLYLSSPWKLCRPPARN